MRIAQSGRSNRPRILTVLLAALAMVLGLLIAAPAASAAAPSSIDPTSATITTGIGGSVTISANGNANGKNVSCNAAGLLDDCFGYTLGVGNPGLGFTAGADGTLTVDPAVGVGTWNLSIHAHNNQGNADLPFTLTVVPAPVLTIGNTVHTVGVDSSTTFVSADGATPTKITCPNCDAVLPAGLVFTNNGNGTPGTAQITGPPATGTGGNYDVHIRQKGVDGAQVDQTVTITVTEGPHFISIDLAEGHVGVPFGFGISTSPAFPPGTTVSITGGALPAGVIFTPIGTGGTLSGTPTVFGQFHVTFTATNGIPALNATQNFTLNIDGPPVINGTPLAHTWLVGTFGSYLITTTPGYPTATFLALSGGALPAGLTFHDNLNGTATISGTPADNVGEGGVYVRTITAANGGLIPNTDSQTLTITVKQAPFFGGATSATFIANQANTSGAITISGGYPLPGHLFLLSVLPAWLHFHPATGKFTGTPSVADSGNIAYDVGVCNNDNTVCRDELFTILVHAPAVTLPTAAPVSDGQILGVQATTDQGSCVSWHASGFAPYAPVTLAAYKVPAYSGKTDLGTYDADASGNVDLSNCLPGALLGAKYIVAAGYRLDSSTAFLTAPTTIKAPVHFGH